MKLINDLSVTSG